MSNVTQLLQRLETGESSATSDLLPLVYEELRKLAAGKLAGEKASPSIQPTVLVHDAFVRLVDKEHQQRWNSRGHFFGAAAEAMRRILIERARQKKTAKHGGEFQRISLYECGSESTADTVDLLALDEALDEFEKAWPEKSMLVKLRYFAGLTVAEAAQAMQISESTAERHWRFARAWLYDKLDA
ncbi:MAG: ECF-type sigma factor [Planctomycetota bacterium]